MLHALKSFFHTHGLSRAYWIAYSGGLDSSVLLHLCATIRNELPIALHAVHINHSLNSRALHWAEHCKKICDQLSIDLHLLTINAKSANGDSPEETARLGRYKAFADLLAPNDILLTAHQQDDQAETVLLQLFRGAGPKGLAAMPAIKSFAKGFHARPLLNFTRDELKQYAKENQLIWIDDESNDNTQFTRNFLRHDVIPLLKTRWPTITKTLSRSAKHCAEVSQWIAEIAEKDLETVMSCDEFSKKNSNPTMKSNQSSNKDLSTSLECNKFSRENLGIKKQSQDLLEQNDIATSTNNSHTMPIQPLLVLTPTHQRHVLRTWFHQLNIPLPSTVKLEQIQKDFFTAREDKLPHIQWKDIELRRYKNHLYVMKHLLPHDAKQSFIWNVKEPLTLPNIGTLNATSVNPIIKEVLVRFRQGGEIYQLPEKKYHQELKKLFQQWNIPPWQRDRVPLIYYNNKIIAVAGYSTDKNFITVDHIVT